MEGLPFINQEDIRNKLIKDPYVGFIVNCITGKDAVEFLNFLETEFNVKWSGKNNLDVNYNLWDTYKERMCYRLEDKECFFGSLNYYSSNYDYKHLTIFQYNNNNIKNDIKENFENVNIIQTKKRKIFIIEDF